MQSGPFKVPAPVNEPIFGYLKGSPERAHLKAALIAIESEVVEIPCIIGGKEVRTGNIFEIRMPHDHKHVIAKMHLAGPKEVQMAIGAALKAKREWELLPWFERTKIFMKAADLLATNVPNGWRYRINAATMHGQSKNAFQAEVDSACEMIDFFRFNASYYERLLQEQPISITGQHNLVEYRGLEGFVLAITPFNFTAIGGNLAAAPAMCGNTIVWKPSETQGLSAYRTMQLFMEAGLPPGVINFIPAPGPIVGDIALKHPELAGVHFTGSTGTFNHIIKTVGTNIETFHTYPRIVGETGGKDFVFADPSADLDTLRVALVRGAFEYQGQKCSAASRAYIPQSLWPKLQTALIAEIEKIKIGDVRDFRNLVNAVIDERSFNKISGYLDWAKSPDSKIKVLTGGEADKSKGYFVKPTLLQASDPKARTMCEEIFGPVLSLYVYDDAKKMEMVKICNETSPYALTGAIIGQDRYAVGEMMTELRHAAGNIYINDKPTGATVGQQPFGGARKSGTNDKAGSALNLVRWMSPRTIKETFVSPKQVLYPYMDEA
ncbi:MAG: L-glutamate gamma-semialdehyde dehydrogenase [Bdellovibrionales bacterium]|nr:L-glutamate gamma-semialdehyde dehydrogenase [Bdellovibrionales bacterium]